MNYYRWIMLMGFLINFINICGINGRPTSNLGGCESTYCAGLRDICKNGGKCVEDPANRCQGKCKCSKRYSGPYCEVDKSSLPVTLTPERQRQPRRYGNIMSFFASLSRKSAKTTKGTTTTTTKAPPTSTSTTTTESPPRVEIEDTKGENVTGKSQDSKNSDDTNSDSDTNDKNDQQESIVPSIDSKGKEDDRDGNKTSITFESEMNDNKNDKNENIVASIDSNGKEEDDDGNKTDTASSEKKRDTNDNKDSEKTSYSKRIINKELDSSKNITNKNDNSDEESQSLETVQNNTNSEEDIGMNNADISSQEKDTKGKIDVVSSNLELTLESFRDLLQADSLFSDGFGLPELQDSPSSNNKGLLGDPLTIMSPQTSKSVAESNSPSDVISQRMSSLSTVHGNAHDHVFSDLSQLIDVPNSKPISTFKPIVLSTVPPLKMLLSNIVIKGAESRMDNNSSKQKANQNSTAASNELVALDIESIIHGDKQNSLKKNETIQDKSKTSTQKSKVKNEIVLHEENASFPLSDGLKSGVSVMNDSPNILNVSKTNDLGSLINKSHSIEKINTSVNSSVLTEETALHQVENTKRKNNDISELKNVTNNTSNLELKRNLTNEKVSNKNSSFNDENRYETSTENALTVSPDIAAVLNGSSLEAQSSAQNENKYNDGTSSSGRTEKTKESIGESVNLKGEKRQNLTESDLNKTRVNDDKNKFVANETSTGHKIDDEKNLENTTQTDLNKTSLNDNTNMTIGISNTENKIFVSGMNDTMQNDSKSKVDGASESNTDQIELVKVNAKSVNVNDSVSVQSTGGKISTSHTNNLTNIDNKGIRTPNKTIDTESAKTSPENVSVNKKNKNNTDTKKIKVAPEKKKEKIDRIDNAVVELETSNKNIKKNKTQFSNQELEKSKSKKNVSRNITKTTENNISEQHVLKELGAVTDPLKNKNENYNINGGKEPAVASDSLNKFASINVKSSDVKFSALKAVSRELATKDGDNTIENRKSRNNRLNEKSHFIDEVEEVSPKERLALKGNGDLFVTDNDIYRQSGGTHLKQENIVTASFGEPTESTTSTTTTETVINKQLISNDAMEQSKVSTENANKSSINPVLNENIITNSVSLSNSSDIHKIDGIATSENNLSAAEISTPTSLKVGTTNIHSPDLTNVTEASVVLPSSDVENTVPKSAVVIVEKTTVDSISVHGLDLETVTETTLTLPLNMGKRNVSNKAASKTIVTEVTPTTSPKLPEKALQGNVLDLTTVTKANTVLPSSNVENESKLISTGMDAAIKHQTNDKEETIITASSEKGFKLLTTNESDMTTKENGTSMSPTSDEGLSKNISNLSSGGNDTEGKISTPSSVDSISESITNNLNQTQLVNKNDPSFRIKTDNVTSNENINVQLENRLIDGQQTSNSSNIDNTNEITTHGPFSTTAIVIVDATLNDTNKNNKTQTLIIMKKPNS